MTGSIRAAVGQGGRNDRDDVRTVQTLLNDVAPSSGGPTPKLAVDGLIGPKTISAISKFQQQRLGFADGRVDPGGRTIGELGGRRGPGNPAPPRTRPPAGPPSPGGGGLPPITTNSVLLCPHGGRIVAAPVGVRPPGPDGAMPLKAQDVFTVAGCAFFIGAIPSPCVRVNWVGAGPDGSLNAGSVGLCIGANGAPQGPAVVT